MRTLKVAGTSVGGSSYARRIMRILNEERSIAAPIEIIVSRGKHQDAVISAIKSDIAIIEQTISIGHPKHKTLIYTFHKETPMSLSDKQFLFLQDVAKLINFCVENEIKITGGELLRTMYQQKEHIRTGRSKTMNSDHLRKLAIDLNFFFNGKLSYSKKDIQPVADYWKSLRPSNYWGGDWKKPVDTPHFGTK